MSHEEKGKPKLELERFGVALLPLVRHLGPALELWLSAPCSS